MKCQNAICHTPARDVKKRFKEELGCRMGEEWFCGEECLEDGLRPVVESLIQGRMRGNRRPASLRPTLGLILLEQGNISQEQLALALEKQKEQPSEKIGQLLKDIGSLEEREVTLALSRQHGIPWVNFVEGKISQEAVRLVPAVIARTYRVLPLDYRSGFATLLVAIVGPPDHAFLHGLGRMLELEVSALVADESKIGDFLDLYYPEQKAQENLLQLQWQDAPTLAGQITALVKKYAAEEVRVARCASRLWVRLERGARRKDLLLELELPDVSEIYVF